jgi:hypothetical protein
MIRVLSLVTCLVMVLSLTACGGSQGTAPVQETQSAQSAQDTQNTQNSPSGSSASAAPDYAWKSSFLPISLDENTPIQPILFTDDGVYASGQVTLGRREASEG